MKKLLLLTFISSIITFQYIEASAKARNEIDEFGRPISSANTRALNQKCVKGCPDYSPNITKCPDGFELKTCETQGCTNYNKCEQSPCAAGYDTKLKDCPIAVQPDNYLCSKCK